MTPELIKLIIEGDVNLQDLLTEIEATSTLIANVSVNVEWSGECTSDLMRCFRRNYTEQFTSKKYLNHFSSSITKLLKEQSDERLLVINSNEGLIAESIRFINLNKHIVKNHE